MSPLLDTPATRREALAGFGALFLALLGMPQFLIPEPAAADEPDRSERVRGVFLGYANREQVSSNYLFDVHGNHTTVTVSELGSGQVLSWTGTSDSPEVAQLFARLIEEQRAIGDLRDKGPSSRVEARAGGWIACPNCRGRAGDEGGCGRCYNGFIWKRAAE